MDFKNFEEIEHRLKNYSTPKRMAVAMAGDSHTIEASIEAQKKGIIVPILVGDKKTILSILEQMGETLPDSAIYDVPEAAAACAFAVQLVREGKADFLMKGLVDTAVLLKAVVNKEQGLGTGRLMSHFSIFQIPHYHKLLTVVDGGMIPYPSLEEKKEIIENTVGILLALGYTCPKVGVLACVEKVNPKMPETVEADALAQMAKQGQIEHCFIDGPISYDCAMSKEIANIKGYEGKTSGDVDILIAPNIHAGNIMGKMLTCTAGARMAGIIVGAKCPIVLSSRGSSFEEKYLSIVLSAAATADGRMQ